MRNKKSLRNKIITIIQVILLIIVLAIGVMACLRIQEVNELKGIVSKQEVMTAEDIETYQKNKYKRENKDYIKVDGDNIAIEDADPFSTQTQVDDRYVAVNAEYVGDIIIPKINSVESIYVGANKTILKLGVGVLHGWDLPMSEKGTTSVIAGHRGYAGIGNFFLKVDQLENDDVIIIKTGAEKLTYKVYNKRVVPPNYLNTIKKDDDKTYLTLVTCTPMWQWTERLLIEAELVNSEEV